MSILPELASSQGRRDDKPNKALGLKLVENRDLEGIKEVAAHLQDKDKKIQVDCLGVLEQVGSLAPELIEDYLDDFLRLASGKDNRLIWQSLINIAKIADRKADEIMDHLEMIIALTESGSVITRDNGIKILAQVGSVKPEYNQQIFPFLVDQLKICRPKSLPQYAESIQVAVGPEMQDQFLRILTSRLEELSDAQAKRVKKVLRKFKRNGI
jgi:hypothetical protein